MVDNKDTNDLLQPLPPDVETELDKVLDKDDID